MGASWTRCAIRETSGFRSSQSVWRKCSLNCSGATPGTETGSLAGMKGTRVNEEIAFVHRNRWRELGSSERDRPGQLQSVARADASHAGKLQYSCESRILS